MNEPESADRYSMIREWEPEGDIYVLTIPEVPGYRTHAATRAEGIRQGHEAIAERIDDARVAGEPVPAPAVFDLGWSETTEDDRVTAPVSNACEAVTAKIDRATL